MGPTWVQHGQAETPMAQTGVGNRFRSEKGGSGYETLIHLQAQMDPTSHQKTIKHRLCFESRAGGYFFIFCQKACQHRPQRAPNSITKTVPCRKRAISFPYSKTNVFWRKTGVRKSHFRHPMRSTIGRKTDLDCDIASGLCFPIFPSIFGWFWEPKLDPHG